MCIFVSPEFARNDSWTSTKRTDYQVSIALYEVPEMFAKEAGKCLGCVTCPFGFDAGGEEQDPHPAATLVDTLRRRVRPHHREILSNRIESFLSPVVAEPLAAAAQEFPLLYNLVTKRPDVALASLADYPEQWDVIDHHIQVVALRDGILNESLTPEVLKGLVATAKSVSIRIDPLIPGYTDTEVVSEIVDGAVEAGIHWISMGVYHQRKGQIDQLPGDTSAVRNSYSGEPTRERPLAPFGAYEGQQVQLLREKCAANGVTLGVWSLEEKLKEEAADHDGCELPTGSEIRRRYERLEHAKFERQAAARERIRELRAVQEPYEWEAD